MTFKPYSWTTKYLDDVTAGILADMLSHNTTLTTLDLGHNSIHFLGASAIADALEINKTLKTLDMNCNPIGYKGIIAIAGALEINSGLETYFGLQ